MTKERMINNQKSKKALGRVEDRAKAGMGWGRSGTGMKGKAAVKGSYRQLTAVQKNILCGSGDEGWSSIGLEAAGREFSLHRVEANFLFGGASVLDN